MRQHGLHVSAVYGHLQTQICQYIYVPELGYTGSVYTDMKSDNKSIKLDSSDYTNITCKCTFFYYAYSQAVELKLVLQFM
jgi:hypothetical protein